MRSCGARWRRFCEFFSKIINFKFFFFHFSNFLPLVGLMKIFLPLILALETRASSVLYDFMHQWWADGRVNPEVNEVVTVDPVMKLLLKDIPEDTPDDTPDDTVKDGLDDLTYSEDASPFKNIAEEEPVNPPTVSLRDRVMSIVSAMTADDALGSGAPNFRDLSLRISGQTVWLQNIFARTDTATIWTVNAHPELVVKFQSDFLEADPLAEQEVEPLPAEMARAVTHPLEREFVFLKLVESSGVAPKALFLSPPASHRIGGRIPMQLNFNAQYTPHQVEGKTVRFLVTQHAGESFASILRRIPAGLPLVTSVQAGIQTLEHLKTLFDQFQVVHGDIHSGNVLVGPDGLVSLIDFGRAFFVSPEPPIITHDFGYWHAHLNTPWQIEGYQDTAHGDVFRTLELMAYLLVGLPYYDSPTYPPTASTRREFKLNFSLLFNSNRALSDQVRGLSAGPHIIAHLQAAHALVLGGFTQSVRPQYEAIIGHLSQALELL